VQDFDPELIQGKRWDLGLISMRERLRLVGGELHIEIPAFPRELESMPGSQYLGDLVEGGDGFESAKGQCMSGVPDIR